MKKSNQNKLQILISINGYKCHALEAVCSNLAGDNQIIKMCVSMLY